jgi:hypothetical protein
MSFLFCTFHVKLNDLNRGTRDERAIYHAWGKWEVHVKLHLQTLGGTDGLEHPGVEGG